MCLTMLEQAFNTIQTDFEKLIERGTEEITRSWIEAVRADHEIPSTDNLREPLLIDSVPLIVQEILRGVDDDRNEINPEKTGDVARHGSARARQRFEVRELVREYQLLRELVFQFLQENLTHFNESDASKMFAIYRRVGSAIDEAMRVGINAFVEERTRELRHLSRTDSLTNLYNHRTFYERLDEELRRAQRYNSLLAVALIDLDNFKAVNDVNGHPFGDRLLIRCAGALRRELRSTDTVCRYGGDEFGVILPETNSAEAIVLLERVRDSLIKVGIDEGAPASFGMSFGLSMHPEDDGTLTRLVHLADERLLQHKAKNKRLSGS